LLKYAINTFDSSYRLHDIRWCASFTLMLLSTGDNNPTSVPIPDKTKRTLVGKIKKVATIGKWSSQKYASALTQGKAAMLLTPESKDQA